MTLWGRLCSCYLHFADEKTKTHIQGSDAGYTANKWQNWEYKPRQSIPETVLRNLILLPLLLLLSKQVCVALLHLPMRAAASRPVPCHFKQRRSRKCKWDPLFENPNLCMLFLCYSYSYACYSWGCGLEKSRRVLSAQSGVLCFQGNTFITTVRILTFRMTRAACKLLQCSPVSNMYVSLIRFAVWIGQ